MKNNLSSRWMIITLFTFLAGCAQMVTKKFQPKKSGTVMYSESFLLREKNRAKALELARDFCQSPISIIAEDNKTEFSGSSTTHQTFNGNSSDGTVTQEKESNVYIHFVCSSKRKKATNDSLDRRVPASTEDYSTGEDTPASELAN